MNLEIPLFNVAVKFDQDKFIYIPDKKKGKGKLSIHNCYMVCRILHLLFQIIKNIQYQTIVTKRSLYYTLLKFYKGSYNLIDLDIKLICQTLQSSRIQFAIMGSSKCQISGTIKINNQLVKGRRIIIGNQSIQLLGNYVLISQKQSVLFSLQQQQYFYQSGIIVITAKGYPDHVIHHLIKYLDREYENIQFYYIGDLDPFGFDIMCQYAFGSASYVYQQFGIPTLKWIFLQKLTQQTNLLLYEEQYGKCDYQKINILLKKQFFNSNSDNYLGKKSRLWKSRIQNLAKRNKKIQMEALVKFYGNSFLSNILQLINQGYYN